MMEDLLPQIDVLPKSSSPSQRNSTRNSTRDSTRRSRSRSLAAESGRNPMQMVDHAFAPPTPQLPVIPSSNSNNISSGMILGGPRSDSPSTASTRSQQRRLEREK